VLGVAIGASVGAIIAQKIFVVPVDRLSDIYLGRPPYAHVTGALLHERLHKFLEIDKAIYYPFLATALLAVLRRDAGYLLGWAAAVPWFLFNFLAKDDQKAIFLAYALSPFIVSVFWVYVYGALLAPERRRMAPGVVEAVFALVCVSSNVGFKRWNVAAYSTVTGDMLHSQSRNRPQVHAFVEAIGRNHARFMRLGVDGAVAAIALEYVQLEENWSPGRQDLDTLMFHLESPQWMNILDDLVLNEMDYCVRIVGTKLVVCSRYPLPPDIFAGIRTQVMPATFAYTKLGGRRVHPQADGIHLDAGASLRYFMGLLPAGHYEYTVTVAPPPAAAAGELLRVAVAWGDKKFLATTSRDHLTVTIPFELTGSTQVGHHFEARAPVTIVSARLRRVTDVVGR
jgi:hypothetical protein